MCHQLIAKWYEYSMAFDCKFVSDAKDTRGRLPCQGSLPLFKGDFGVSGGLRAPGIGSRLGAPACGAPRSGPESPGRLGGWELIPASPG
jgi:hypothetical protein